MVGVIRNIAKRATSVVFSFIAQTFYNQQLYCVVLAVKAGFGNLGWKENFLFVAVKLTFKFSIFVK
ncbi:MAG TPA: hypothetical protein DCQ92_16185 [Verrucomicrobia subdivision 3 bacterium]|nr:hypothetical protein [Limisphaerales bacterium]